MLVGAVHDPVVDPLGPQPLAPARGLVGPVAVHRPLIPAHQGVGHLALGDVGGGAHQARSSSTPRCTL